MKGLPLAYNRDLQEDKIPLFDTVDTVKASLEVMRELAREMRVKKERMAVAAADGHMNATDLADYLASKGTPFRSAHRLVGKIVRAAVERGCRIEELPLGELRRFSPKIKQDVYAYLTPEAAVDRRRSEGGTAPINVRRRLKEMGI
jgi:argininosuccinate lyase